MTDKERYDQLYGPHEKTFVVDYRAMVQWQGQHRDIPYSINEHGFKAFRDGPFGGCQSTWCTYIYLNDEMHEKFKTRINDAPWNGGQTYYRKITEEHIDVSFELAEEWNKPFWKIGDDFNHSWDDELYDMYSKDYMERHIKSVIDYLLDGPKDEEK